VEVDFSVVGRPSITLTGFVRSEWADARPQFLAIAPDHPVLAELLPQGQIGTLRPMGQRRRAHLPAETLTEGFDSGLEAVDRGSGTRLPIFIARYVDPTFATGIEIACTSSDPRARRFAERHAIACAAATGTPLKGRPVTYYRVRDWLVSRQRAWGTPIPIVYCEQCGEVPVPEQALPVRVPALTPNMPAGGLAAPPGFMSTECPRCTRPAQRETDTLDCYFDVIWCFLACANGLRSDFKFQASDFADWMPVDWFHNGLDSLFYMHLYRFLGHVLHEAGVLPEPEPIRSYVGHDAVLLDGRKMSKHHGNVVSPDDVIARVGADMLRIQVLWAANPLRSVEWSELGLQRAKRLLLDIWSLIDGQAEQLRALADQMPKGESRALLPLDRALARAVRRITEFLDRYQYAGCLEQIQTLLRLLDSESRRLVDHNIDFQKSFANAIRSLVIVLAPFAPHMAEELWERIGGEGFLACAEWPGFARDRPVDGTPRSGKRQPAPGSESPSVGAATSISRPNAVFGRQNGAHH
jgi:leucyl-tRNA synthetase